jgi:hypothetical protein
MPPIGACKLGLLLLNDSVNDAGILEVQFHAIDSILRLPGEQKSCQEKIPAADRDSDLTNGIKRVGI